MPFQSFGRNFPRCNTVTAPTPSSTANPSPAPRATSSSRIRKALDHPTDHSPTPGPAPALDQSLIRQVVPPTTTDSRAALINRWQQKMTENKATVHRLPSPDPTALLATLDACLANHPTAKRALLNLQQLEGTSPNQFPIAGHLRAKHFTTTDWAADRATAFADAFTADVAITDAPSGLADTGSLLVWSHANFGRSSTLVTPIHITLLPASRILPDLIDGLAFVQQEYAKNGGGLPSNIVVINGPSKTGDIEMKLVTGVHGPKYMYILLLDGM